MKADKSSMFPVSLKTLKAEDGAPFPLFLFLRRNDRFIPIRLPGDAIGLQKYEAFLARQHAELWVPNSFQEVFKSYLDYLARTGNPVAELSEVVAKIEGEAPSKPNAPAAALAAASETPSMALAPRLDLFFVPSSLTIA